MSQEGSEGWETASDRSKQGDQENANPGTSKDTSSPGIGPETELSFSKKSLEEVERDAATLIRRTSSISSRLSCLSISGLTSLPPQSPTQQPQTSPSPEKLSHDPQRDCTRSSTSPVLEHHKPTSSTQKRGPGIPRNPVSDTWRDEVYTKENSGKGKMVDVANQLDRWRCEYCSRLNNGGVVTDASEIKIKGSVQIPGSIPPGIAPGEVVKCAHCGEQMFLELTRYDPREEAEDGVCWNAVQDPEEVKALRREILKGKPLNRVRERWREDERRRQEEESGKKKGDEAENIDQGADEAETADQGADDEWEDED